MIHRFQVRNFKSVIDVSVEMSLVTVFVGRSGTGKTNFVHSIRLLRDILSSRQQVHVIQQQWAQMRPAATPRGPLQFDIEFSISGIDERYHYQLAFDEHLAQVSVERLTLGNKVLFHQANAADPRGSNPQAKWVKQPDLLQPPPAGPIALGRIPSVSEVVIAFTALTAGIGCYAFSDDVLCGPNRARKNHIQSTNGLDDEATNYLVTLKEIVSNLQDLNVRKSIIGALQRVNPSVSSVELNDLLQPSDILVGHKFDGKTLVLGLSQESDGFRRFYAHLLALYQRPPKQTLIFEHPEDGIHPGALTLLAEEIKAAPGNGRGQVILTTHNPKLLDQFDADQIRVVELDGFATKIGPVSDEQKEAIRDRLLDTGELLTVDPARIEREAVAP